MTHQDTAIRRIMAGSPGLMMPGPGGAPARHADMDPAAGLPLDADVRLGMDADLCRWASGPCGCGGPSAPPRICSHPARPREVRRPDCLKCVTMNDWHGRPEG